LRYISKWALAGFTESMAQEMPAEWKIKFILLEPGGTKTDFATRSMKTAPPHPAYSDPNMAANAFIQYLSDPKNLEGWVPPESAIEKMLQVLGKEDMPLRLCTGKDAYEALSNADRVRTEEMEKWKHVSTG
jgi:NAD(P)-dependent dehydrogenase (short-subunit alcohol dehydrogenase family)